MAVVVAYLFARRLVFPLAPPFPPWDLSSDALIPFLAPLFPPWEQSSGALIPFLAPLFPPWEQSSGALIPFLAPPWGELSSGARLRGGPGRVIYWAAGNVLGGTPSPSSPCGRCHLSRGRGKTKMPVVAAYPFARQFVFLLRSSLMGSSRATRSFPSWLPPGGSWRRRRLRGGPGQVTFLANHVIGEPPLRHRPAGDATSPSGEARLRCRLSRRTCSPSGEARPGRRREGKKTSGQAIRPDVFCGAKPRRFIPILFNNSVKAAYNAQIWHSY